MMYFDYIYPPLLSLIPSSFLLVFCFSNIPPTIATSYFYLHLGSTCVKENDPYLYF
jgi:hypothetical protein